MRSFDPRAVGGLETRAWETYYRRRWAAAAIAFVRLVRAAFGMSWRLTFEGAWYVLRANQKWAPYPDNDPDAARAYMARFYRLLKAAEGLDIDPVKASELEVGRSPRCSRRSIVSSPSALGLWGLVIGITLGDLTWPRRS